MKRPLPNDVRELLQRNEQTSPVPITQDDLTELPEPVRRYLRYAQIVGKEPIRTVRLMQRGVMRQQPGQRWMPFVAQHYYTINPPSFLWHCIMRPFPLLWIPATDRFSEGHGGMNIKLLSCLSLGNERGTQLDQGELQRYLGEMVWFPTAWLSDTVDWQGTDAHSVQATLHEQNVTGSVILHVNEQGELTHVTANRSMGQHGRLTPWSVHIQNYQEICGMRIPTMVEVTWHLANGDFPWFRAKITEIEYNQSGKVEGV